MLHPVWRSGLCSLAILSFMTTTDAEDKKLPIERTSNDLVEISAVAIMDKEQIKQELSSDFGGDIVLVRVTVRPVSDTPIRINLDDFLLVSGKDGQRAQPYTPSQLAGGEVLVVTRQEAKRSGGLSAGFGGLMGGGGGGGGGEQKTETKMEKPESDKSDPLLDVLKAKVLPEKEITETISGFLYFQIVGKVKPKDLELHYKGSAGKMTLRFRP
jgi:hypothetical protein